MAMIDQVLVMAVVVLLVVKRTKLVVAVGAVTGAELLVMSEALDSYPIGQSLLISSIVLMLTCYCINEWQTENKAVSRCMALLSFLALCLSFSRLALFGIVYDPVIMEAWQYRVMEFTRGVTICMIACLALLPDKRIPLHDMVRGLMDGAGRARDLLGLHSHRDGKT